jgi:tripartite-type tricarboxylate transporter receptor subunit TctC
MRFLRFVTAALLGVAMLGSAHAQSWPAKPIRWIVPYPPGGGTDLVARAIGAKLSEYLCQPVVIENKPGGNTIIGTAALAQAQPDGYTLALITDAHAINAASGKNLPYDSERDVVPVVQLLYVPFLLIANSEKVPMRTLPELVKKAKDDAGWLTFGSLGPGSPHEIAISWFKSMAKIDMLIVPYRGIGPAFQDTIAGHVKTMMVGVSVADEMIKAGKVHPIAVTSQTRLKTAPDVPTIAESGYPQYVFITWYGVVMPRGTPDDIVARLNSEINRALRDPEVRSKIGSAGGDIAGGTQDHLVQLMRGDIAKYRKIFAETGYRFD